MRTNKCKRERTVAALLNVQMKGILNRQHYRSHPKHAFICCRSQTIAKLFLANAESEGFSFGDGQLPTSKEPTDIYALKNDFTITYTGWVQGLWVKEFGFKVGEPVLVKCENGKLMISLDRDRVAAEEREQARLDEEMRKLQKQFEQEKKKIYRQIVAERETRHV